MRKNSLTDDSFDNLIIDFLTGSITPEGLDELQHQLNLDRENQRYFTRVRNAWIASGKPVSTFELDLGWSAIQNRLDIQNVDIQSHSKNSGFRWLPVAASWLIFLVAGSFLTWIFTHPKTDKRDGKIEMSVPLGARGFIKMPDGTEIWLNAGTTIIYNADYGLKTRTIDLTGEAFFDVAKDVDHPFLVHTSDMEVQAVGTRFNVKAYPDEKTIAATLEEGIIDVRILESGKRKPISLNENDKIVLLKQAVQGKEFTENSDERTFKTNTQSGTGISDNQVVSIISNVNTKLYTSWKDSRWIIQSEELGTLAPMFERRFNIRIVFSNESLKNYKFSGTIENETVDQIMDLLTLTAPIQYEIDKDVITLKLDKKNMIEFGKTITRSN